MSKMNEIISKVVTDEEFRSEFLADPVKATESMNLTKEEIAELKSIDLSEITAINQELEDRISKSFVGAPIEAEAEAGHSSEHSSHSSDCGW